MIALVHGPDRAICRAQVARLVASRDPEGANTTHLDGREVSLPQIAAAIGSVGFFGGGRVVVVHDLMIRASRGKSGSADADDEDAQPTAAVDLKPLFAAVPDENLLVLVDAGLSAVPASIKRAVPSDAIVVAAEPPRAANLVAWITTASHEAGGDLDAATARLLAETLYPQTWLAKPSNPRFDRPPDTELLRNEVEKLVLAAHPGPVSADHVKALVAGGVEERVFRFVEAGGGGGRLDVALNELDRLLVAGEEPAKLLAQLDQQIELAAVLAAGPRVDPVAAGRALGLSNPARMSAVSASRRGRSADSDFAAVSAAVETDRSLKRGRLRQPEDALYGLLATVRRHVGGT